MTQPMPPVSLDNLGQMVDPVQGPALTERPPTPGQLAELQYALRNGRIVTLATRHNQLPAAAQRMERRGWITVTGQLTDLGRAVAERYELVNGAVTLAGGDPR